MRTDRLVLNRDSPFSRYIGKEHIQEIHNGWIYQSWLDHYQDNINKRNWFPVGLLLYVDKTHTDVRGRFCLEPVIAYLTLLDRVSRSELQAQIILGYINDLELSSSASKSSSNTPKTRGRSCCNYHAQLEVLLRGIYDLQPDFPSHLKSDGSDLLRARIRINDPINQISHKKVCRIVPFVVAILGDGKSQDHMVGRYALYNS